MLWPTKKITTSHTYDVLKSNFLNFFHAMRKKTLIETLATEKTRLKSVAINGKTRKKTKTAMFLWWSKMAASAVPYQVSFVTSSNTYGYSQ